MTPSSANSRPRLTLVAGLLLACACQSNAAREGYGVTAVQFQDVVVPTGLILRDRANESYSREEAGWRQGHFVYSGPTDMAVALSYVRERMPQHSWQIVADEAVDETVSLRFVRGIYSADYTFARREGATHMVVTYNTDHSRR